MAEQLDTRQLNTTVRQHLLRKGVELVQRRQAEQTQHPKATEWFERTPLDNLERQRRIRRQGLPALIKWREDTSRSTEDPHYQILVQPTKDFITLDSHSYAERRLRHDPDLPYWDPDKFPPYHITLGHKSRFENTGNQRWDDWYKTTIDQLREKYREPKEHTFTISGFGQGNSANISPYDKVYREIIDLHRRGGHGQVHISM